MTVRGGAPTDVAHDAPSVGRSGLGAAPTRSPRRGVLILVVAVVTQVMTGPGQTVGISVFVDHIAHDLALSRTAISAAYLIGTAAGALSLPLAGRLIDRRGLRWATTGFAFAFGAVLIAMGSVVGFATLALGFAGTRMLGQGALTLTATTAVAVSFDRHRGTAIGIKSAAAGGLMSLFPLAGGALIAGWGWRTAFVVLGVATWVILLPLARSFLHDERPGANAARRLQDSATAPGASRAHALRQPMFWIMTAAVALSALITTALVFHQIAILGERGYTRGQATANFVPQAIAAAVAALATGRIADRVRPTRLLPAAMALLAAAPLMAQLSQPGPSALIYGAVLGAAAASVRTIEATTLPRWFGTAHIGEIRGVVLSLAVAASAVGPFLLAVGVEVTGDYNACLTTMAVAAGLVGVLAAGARVPCTVAPAR